MTGYLSLGSNVGDRRAQLQGAVDALRAGGVAVTASSSVYDTDPVGEILDQPTFLNVCVRIETDLEPEALLDVAKEIELRQGRDPSLPRHSPRPVDIDLILLGEKPYRSARLSLPRSAYWRITSAPWPHPQPRQYRPTTGARSETESRQCCWISAGALRTPCPSSRHRPQRS